MSNVYAAPVANLSDAAAGDDTIMFSLNSRIGRVRWIAYMSGMWLLVSVGMGLVIALVTAASPQLAKTLDFLNAIAALCIFVFISRRRLRDLGLGPIFLGLAVIPFVNLYFFFMMIFKRGDDGANEYGQAPSPNTRSVYLLAWIMPIIMVIGILAAIAIPAYQAYTIKARANAVQVLPQQ